MVSESVVVRGPSDQERMGELDRGHRRIAIKNGRTEGRKPECFIFCGSVLYPHHGISAVLYRIDK